MGKFLTTEEFIRRAREVHGDKYDYSKAEFLNGQTKVCIICPIHGEFWQRPYDHLRGHGCRKCVGLYKRTTEEFIADAIKIHGDKYDYSKVEYVNNTTPVCIICSIHGEFWQTPKNHLKGMGCRKCYNDSIRITRLKPFDVFVAESRMVHGDKFEYVEDTYKKDKIHTKIICPIHGPFWQTPNNHLHGYGCPSCNESHGEREIAKWLNNHNVGYNRQYNIIPQQVLFGRNRFRVDFYLPTYNTIIEFNGSQHYERATNWHTEEQFADQQDRDRRLREHCKQHGITLIEIPYTEFDNIDKILSKKIKVKP